MNAVTYAVLGILLYATQNIIMEAKLRSYSTAAVVLTFYFATAPIVLIVLAKMRLSGETVVWPSGSGLWFALAAGAVYFFADYFYVSAYNKAGGDVFAVTVCAGLLPVFVSVLSFVLTRRVPNVYQVAGMLLAAGAVTLVALGSGKTQ